MAIRAHTKLPCIRIIQTNGVAVGHIQRYRCSRIRILGEPLKTKQPVNVYFTYPYCLGSDESVLQSHNRDACCAPMRQ